MRRATLRARVHTALRSHASSLIPSYFRFCSPSFPSRGRTTLSAGNALVTGARSGQACTLRGPRRLSAGRDYHSGGSVTRPPRPLSTLPPPQLAPIPLMRLCVFQVVLACAANLDELVHVSPVRMTLEVRCITACALGWRREDAPVGCWARSTRP
jgi:hypothetical protein